MGTSTERDVVVVGAGYAGLAAAWALKSAGLEATVVEARERVGGRVWTEAAEDGTFIDHGGQWVGPTQDRILALAAEMGVETFPTYGLEGDRHVSIQGSSDLSLELIGEAVEALERMAAELPAEAPWRAEEAAAWDAETLQTWMLANVPDPLGRDLLRAVINAVFTAEPGELSLLHVLAYIRAGGSMMLLTQIEGGAQERRFVGGAQAVAKRLAERLGPDVVRLGAPVRRIEQGAGAVEVVADGVTLSARRAIVSVPVAVGGQIAYSPPLPGRRAQLHTRMSPGATIKIHCVYPTPFWREIGHSGRSFNDDGFASVVFDNTCPDSERGVLVAFAEADAGRRFAALPEAERRQAVLDELVGIFGGRAAEPLAYYEQNWLEEEWTRGCFGGNFGPGGWTRYGEALCEPFGLVHWAGAETSPVWMNYIDGAVRSGERAAAEVVAALA